MTYITTEVQEKHRQWVRQIAEEHITPRASEIDRTGEFPWDIFQLFKKKGILRILLPKECGGWEADYITSCITVEELARVDLSCCGIITTNWLAAEPIMIAGTSEQKKKYLFRLSNGEGMMAFGLTERNAGSDVAAMESVVKLEGEHYVLNGAKCFISLGSVATIYSVFAKTDPEKGVRGISAFIVERDYPGFSIGKVEDKMGLRGIPVAELFFKNCPVPKENLLGEVDRGFTYAMITLDRTRPLIGAQAVGIAQGALDYAIQYDKKRVQFGAPIANLQAIQFILADMAIQIEAARAMVYRAAAATDHNAPDLTYLSAISKTFASDIAMAVTTNAVQLLGGYGYMKDHPLERMMRDAKITQIYEGTNQIQRLIIARRLLGR